MLLLKITMLHINMEAIQKYVAALNHIAHRYRFDKFRVFEKKLIRPSEVEASTLEMLRAGAIRDCVQLRDELRHINTQLDCIITILSHL